jgi:hypothetical protein
MQGIIVFDSNGVAHKICIYLLLWLGDQLENNELAGLYAQACRRCTRQETTDGMQMWSKTMANIFFSQMLDLYYTPGCRMEAYELSKLCQQHISKVLFLSNRFHYLIAASPCSIGIL